jgi:restriction system protein
LDLIAQSDPLGVRGRRIKGQVKRRPRQQDDGGGSAVLPVAHRHGGPLSYSSLGGFTSDTQAAARRSFRRITLIDGQGLLDLWVEHYSALDEEAKGLLPFKPSRRAVRRWYCAAPPSILASCSTRVPRH